MAHKAVVVRLKNVRKHPNADRLQLATAAGNQVIVGLEHKENELGIFFDCELQLSERFAQEHDLVQRKDEHGNRAGGFFAKNRRVRAVNLRGEKSYGFWVPLDYLLFTGRAMPVAGTEFDTWNGIPICNKYVTPATRQAQSKRGLRARKETPMFRMHFDTKQLMREIKQVPIGSLVIITEKLHGTSHRLGHVKDDVKQSWWQKLLKIKRQKWAYLSGTRRVIIRDGYKGYYSDEQFRDIACKPLLGSLKKGEVVYFEIVGWVSAQKPIMASHDMTKLRDVQDYGGKITYTYGCPPGTCDIYVYRIVLTNEDGYGIDYPWSLVKQRCNELGVKHVPELVSPFMLESHRDLQSMAESLCVGPSTIDPSHIREGVAVRFEPPYNILKHKSWEFLFLEGVLKEKPDHVDLEEIS